MRPSSECMNRMWSSPQVTIRPENERSQASPPSPSYSCSPGWRKPAGECQPMAAPLILAVGDVERAVDQDGEAQAGAGAELEHADAALDAVAQRHQPHAGELRQHARRARATSRRVICRAAVEARPSPSARPFARNLPVQEFLGARHVGLLEMLDDDRDVRMLLGQALEVEVVVQRAQARAPAARSRRRRGRCGSRARPRRRCRRASRTCRRPARLTSLACAILILSVSVSNTWFRIRVHLVDVVVLEIVGRVHQQAEARMVDLRRTSAPSPRPSRRRC